MKKVILTCMSAIMLIQTANAQSEIRKNIIKTNLFSYAFRGINIAYERVLTKKSTVQIGFNYILNGGIPFVGGTIETAFKEGGLSNFQFTGFQLTPEYRFYTGQKGAGKGFYLAPFLRLSNWSLSGDAIIPSGPVPNGTIANVRLTPLGAGLAIGAQWMIKNRVSIDWTIFGLGFTSSKLTVEIKNESIAFSSNQQAELRSQLEKQAPGFDVTVSNNSASVAYSSLLPMLRTGLSIGIAFNTLYFSNFLSKIFFQVFYLKS